MSTTRLRWHGDRRDPDSLHGRQSTELKNQEGPIMASLRVRSLIVFVAIIAMGYVSVAAAADAALTAAVASPARPAAAGGFR